MARAERRKQEAEARAAASRPPTKSDRTRAGMTQEPRTGLRARLSARMMSVGFLRRRYVKRMLKYIDKTQAKGKRLPPELYDLQRFLSQVPKAQRAERLEEAITAQRREEPLGNRDLRRASSNQSRQSGRGGGRHRPGMAPRSLQPGPKIPKKPR